MRLQILLAGILALAAATKVRYDGFKLIRVKAQNENQVKALQTLQQFPGLIFWKEPGLTLPTDIAVPPAAVANVTSFIEGLGLKPEVGIENIQELIDAEDRQNSYAKAVSTFRSGGLAGLARVKSYFMRFDEINTWMYEMAEHFPNTKIVSLGRSYEGRDTKALMVGNGDKPAIFIDSGIHAREWVSVSTNLYMMYELLMGSKTGATTGLLEKYDWIFVPVVNPDGYEYTFDYKRMWRKNRRPMRWCVGADPNRNFDINFGGVGTSGNACYDTYRGPRAFSEPCARNLAKFLIERGRKVRAYMSLHAYSQMWFVPYAYDRYRKPDDINELLRVANAGTNAIYSTHGRIYTVGSPGEILYEASGSTMDWVKAKTKIKYSYGIEMRPDMNTPNGFIVPPSQIVPAGEEMWEGIKAMAREMQ